MTRDTTEPAINGGRDTSHHQLTSPAKPLSHQIVAVVADVADCSLDELPPLYEVVNSDALNHLFAPTYDGDTRSVGQVRLTYAGYEVVVHSTGDVDVSPLDAAGEQHE